MLSEDCADTAEKGPNGPRAWARTAGVHLPRERWMACDDSAPEVIVGVDAFFRLDVPKPGVNGGGSGAIRSLVQSRVAKDGSEMVNRYPLSQTGRCSPPVSRRARAFSSRHHSIENRFDTQDPRQGRGCSPSCLVVTTR